MSLSLKKIAILGACFSLLAADSAAVLANNPISSHSCAAQLTLKERLQAVISENFSSIPKEEIGISPLTGGYSGARNYIIDVKGRRYALRLQTYEEIPAKIARELYMMQHAAALGLAPAIFSISDGGRAILMDYIPGGTLSHESSKDPKNIRAIGEAIARVHAIPKGKVETIDFENAMQKYYREIVDRAPEPEDLDKAIQIIHCATPQLKKLQGVQTNIHGDLNPRNIFVRDNKVYFIDWSETLWDDPFLDLAYYVVLTGYDEKEEILLLESYLGRPLKEVERERYRLAKKLTYARLCLGAYYVVIQRMEDYGESVTPLGQEFSWQENAKRFASGESELTAQYFYGAAKSALHAAQQ